jgi:hypothetical protein
MDLHQSSGTLDPVSLRVAKIRAQFRFTFKRHVIEIVTQLDGE